MKPFRLLTIVALSATAGCAGGAPPVTPEMQARADRAAKIGQFIYEQDHAAAMATDVLVQAVGSGPASPLRGWVTRIASGTATTSFVAGEGDALNVVYEVVAPVAGRGQLTAVDPPRPLDAEGAAMFRAEQTAKHAVRGPCRSVYNPVVLPASLEDKDGWLVYLLASTTRSDVAILAGHRLVRVSSDGNQVLEDVPLSASCIVAPMDPKAVGVMVSRLRGDVPNEGDYFTARQYGKDLFVVFRSGAVWKVEAPKL